MLTPSAVEDRIRDLCRQFRLPTLAAETVRFTDAGHADALPTLTRFGAGGGGQATAGGQERASKLPAGKTWDTFELERAPVKLRQQLVRLAEGDFAEFNDLRPPSRLTLCAPRPQAGAVRALRTVHPGVQARAGHAGGQASRSAADAQEAGQLRPAGHRRPGLPAPGG